MSFIKSLPITSDMVSLWVPSGTSAIDLIRENHGQVSGAHPNVLVNTGLLDTSLGWYFDGTDDYIGCGDINALDGLSAITASCWAYSSDFTANGGLVSKNPSNSAWQLYIYGSVIRWRGDGTTNLDATPPANDMWHHFLVTQSGTSATIYIDAEAASSGTVDALGSSTGDVQIGRLDDAFTLDGYIALPFVANTAWSLAQVNNFYLATKGLFSPRG